MTLQGRGPWCLGLWWGVDGMREVGHRGAGRGWHAGGGSRSHVGALVHLGLNVKLKGALVDCQRPGWRLHIRLRVSVGSEVRWGWWMGSWLGFHVFGTWEGIGEVFWSAHWVGVGPGLGIHPLSIRFDKAWGYEWRSKFSRSGGGRCRNFRWAIKRVWIVNRGMVLALLLCLCNLGKGNLGSALGMSTLVGQFLSESLNTDRWQA